MLIDLQLHSNYSDGYLTPTEIADFISSQGVKAAALTDHNTVGGVYEFRKACKKRNIKPITGVELYVKHINKKFNLLWYNFDETNPELHNILRNSQRRRRQMMRIALDKLKNKGFVIAVDKILDKYNHYVPVNHVVDDILSNNKNVIKIKKDLKINNVEEADVINNYLRHNTVGKLVNSFINLERILRLKEKIGGQTILCHPAKHSYIRRENWEKYKEMGIDGVELLSPHHSYGAIMQIQHLARELNFIETGGSDFHRFEGGGFAIQNSWQYFKVDSDMLRGVKNIIG